MTTRIRLLAVLVLSLLAFAATRADEPIVLKKPPPLGTFGVHYCNKIILWVLTPDGHIYRVTDEVLAQADPVTQRLIKEWIKSGPTDIVEMTCTVEV